MKVRCVCDHLQLQNTQTIACTKLNLYTYIDRFTQLYIHTIVLVQHIHRLMEYTLYIYKLHKDKQPQMVHIKRSHREWQNYVKVSHVVAHRKKTESWCHYASGRTPITTKRYIYKRALPHITGLVLVEVVD